MHSLLLLRYLKWHFIDASREILKGWGNILWFNLNYFSVLALLQTFFSPWRKIAWSYGRGFDIGRYLYVFASNLISRILGAFVRSFLIGAGLIGEIFFFAIGLVVFLLWLALPALIVLGFFYGLTLLI